jgi:hypothetical protein
MAARSGIPAPPYGGGCLCGAVRFALSAQPKAINACHCTDCRKATGAGAAIFLHMPSDAIAVTGETTRYRKTADSGREIDIVRCLACGTRLWHRPASYPQLSFVCAGTLDNVSWVIPTSHIWVASGAPTDSVTDDAINFDGPAPDRQPLWDHFAKLYPGA